MHKAWGATEAFMGDGGKVLTADGSHVVNEVGEGNVVLEDNFQRKIEQFSVWVDF